MNTYTLRIDQLIDSHGTSHTTYGINIIDRDNLIITKTIPNIFCDLLKAIRFIHLINRINLSPLHLYDAVTDTID